MKKLDFKQKIDEETEWIVSTNPEKFDYIKSFEIDGFVDWRQNRKYEIDDIVYIYASHSVGKITAICKVSKINIPRDEVKFHPELWKEGKPDNDGINTFVRFELIDFIKDDERLNYSELKKHGLKGTIQAPRKVKGELLEYVHEVVSKK